MSTSQNILTMPLNVNCEDIIKKLKSIRFTQGAALEELFKDYNSLSALVKQQQQQERQQQFMKLQQQQNQLKLSAANPNENEDNSSSYHNDYEEALRVEFRKAEDKLQKDINRLALLESQNKNLRDESALKSQNFQSNFREMIAEAKQLQFERVSINHKVNFAECNDGIVYMCEMETPYQTIRGVQYSERSLNALGVSVGRDCNVKSLSVFKNTVCVAYHSKEIELFQMEQNNSRRLCGIEAHLQQIQFACLIDPQLILTAGINKNIMKLWNYKGQLLKSFKTQAYPTAVALINDHIPFKNPQDQSKSDQLKSYNTNIQLAVGFSDGTIKLLELAGSSDSEPLETITNWSLNQIHEIQIVPQTSIAAQDCSIKCIQIAYNNSAEKNSLLHQSIKGFQSNFGLKSRLQTQETVSLSNFTIASTIQGDIKSIFVAILSKEKVFSTADYSSPAVSSQVFSNTSNSKYFSVTPDYLIAGSSQGNIHLWDLRGLSHPLMFYTPQMELKAVIPIQQNTEILLAQYDLQADELVTVDAQGNILKWEQFIGELERQKKQGQLKNV